MTHVAPRPTPQIDAVPASVPFIAPETLAREAGLSSLVRLGANESAFGPSPRAIEAMQRELAHLSWYGDPENTELRAVLAARHACTPENITVASGIDDLHSLLVRTYVGNGGTALATRGTYPTFAYHVAGFGGRLVTVDYRTDGTLDVDAFIAAMQRERPTLAFLANPDNPSGTFLDRETIARIVEGAPEQTLVLLDEAYADFVDAQALPPETIDPRLVRTRTFSKAYGLAGARVGYLVGSRELVTTLQKIRLHFGVNRNAQIGALAALADESFLREVVAEVARGRDEYHALARTHGLRSLPSATNFVTIEIGTRAQAEAMVAELLRAGVFVRKPGASPLDGFIRVTVGRAEERRAFAEAFARALPSVRELEAAKAGP